MWKKNFRIRKAQTAMIFIIILFCSMVMNASISIFTSLDEPFRDFAIECEAATLLVYPYDDSMESVRKMEENFKSLSQVNEVRKEENCNIQEEFTVDDKKIEAFPMLTTYDEAIYSNIRMISGTIEDVRQLKENEIIVPACISNEYDIKVGNTIIVHYSAGDREYTVRGIYAEPYSISSAYTIRFFVKELPLDANIEYTLFIYGNEKMDGQSLVNEYRRQFDGILPAYTAPIEEMESNALLTGKIVGGVFLAISIIMLLVSGLIINFMIRHVMLMDAKNVAIYKTIGYSYGQVLKMYLSFYFVIVSVASLIGISLSKVVSSRLLNEVFAAMGESGSKNTFLLGLPCYIVVVGFVLLIIYSILHKMKQVKPVEVFQGYNSTNTKKKRYHTNKHYSFSPLGITLRAMSREKKGMVGIILISAATILLVNFALISLDVAYSVEDNNDYWFGIDDSQVYIGVNDGNTIEEVKEQVERDPRVEKTAEVSLEDANVTLKWEEGRTITYMNPFIYESYEGLNLPLITGRNPQYADEIAISSLMADEWEKEVGDYIDIYLEGNKKVSLLVTGIYQTYFSMGKSCRLVGATYVDNGMDFQYTKLSVYLKEGTDVTEFINDIKTGMGSKVTVQKRTELFSSIMDMIVTPQKSAIPPMMVIILMVSAVNIFGIVLLKNSSSEKINGIYKCIGYATGHLIRSNVWYVAIISIVSMAVAVPVCLVCYESLMTACLGMFGLKEYKVTYHMLHLVIGNVVVLAVFIVSTILSSLSIRRVKVRDLVQE